jgi:hypothetical protein
MYKLITSFVALVAASGATAADLPSKTNAVAPKAVVADSEKNVYGGLSGGFVVTDGLNKNSPWAVGLVGGYNVYRFAGVTVAGEADYDYTKGDVNTFTLNSVVNYDTGFVTPYVFGGVGYRNESHRDRNVYNYGGGLKYAISSSIDLDGRFRRTDDLKSKTTNKAEDRVSLGVNYKF